MTQILGISFDGVAAPLMSLKPDSLTPKTEDIKYGWGYGWYPEGNRAATVLKDAISADSSSINKLLNAWKRFHSTVFICHLRGASKHLQQQNTQPFSRSYAGRDWIMLHNGDLENYKVGLPLLDNPVFEPLGTTDSEHMFCWLMTKIHHAKARQLSDVDKTELMSWLQTINSLGTANIMLSDGIDLLIYQDQGLFNQLLCCRRHPPYTNTTLESEGFIIDLSSSFDMARTMVLFATQAMTDDEWVNMESGQALIARRGWIKWDSTKLQQEDEHVSTLVAPNPNKYLSYRAAILEVTHETRYRYSKPVELSKHIIRLKPYHGEKQELQSFELTMEPSGEHLNFTDVFDNNVSYLKIQEPYQEFSIVAKSTLLVHPRDLKQEPLATEHQRLPLVWMPWQQQVLLPYLLPPELPLSNLEELTEYAMSFVERNNNNLFEVLNDINMVIYQDYHYVSESTDLFTTPYEIYTARRGVCQDFANLFICLARLLNIPARYRTGYIFTGANNQNKVQSEASHAWVEVYIPLVGWRGFDPTNGVLANTDHIKVACGRHYRDATPTSGTIYEGGGEETMEVSVKVDKKEI